MIVNLRFLAGLLLAVRLTHCGLLRTPKVYNALITTDQNLTPSRSFPIIQPHIHETYHSAGGYPYASGAYNSYSSSPSYYDPYYSSAHFGNQFGYHRAFSAGDPALYAPGAGQFVGYQPIVPQERSGGQPSSGEEPSQTEVSPTTTDGSAESTENPVGAAAGTESPIPLNEFGLPPSLVALNPYGYQSNPVNLSPYPYSSYPLIYDHYSGYNTNPYLPPFGYYPQLDIGNFGLGGGGGGSGGGGGDAGQRKKQGGGKKNKNGSGGVDGQPNESSPSNGPSRKVDPGSESNPNGSRGGGSSRGGNGSGDSGNNGSGSGGNGSDGNSNGGSGSDGNGNGGSGSGGSASDGNGNDGNGNDGSGSGGSGSGGSGSGGNGNGANGGGGSGSGGFNGNNGRGGNGESSSFGFNGQNGGSRGQSSGTGRQSSSSASGRSLNYTKLNKDIPDVPPPPLPRGAKNTNK